MALQSSGQISLQDIQDEFGGSHPISLSEYYGSDTVPSSGAISLNDFYGTSSVIPVDITYNGQYSDESNRSSYTWSSAPIGTATSDRKVIVGVASTGNNSGVSVSGCTIGGVSATQELYVSSTEPDNRSQLVFYSRTITSGTTATVTVNLTGSQDRFGMVSYSVYNSTGTNATASDTVDSSGVLSASVNCPDNGAVLGFAFNQENGGTWTWSGLSENVDVDIGGGNSSMSGAHTEFTSGGSKSVSATCTDSSPLRQVLGLISFNP